MITRGDNYQVTNTFIGFIWRGQTIIGFDLAEWAWIVVFMKWYIGWNRENDNKS